MTPEQKFIDFFENLTANNLDQIETLFSSDARFKDPFNEVTNMCLYNIYTT